MNRPRLHLLVIWLAISVILGGLLLVSRQLDGPLDDRDLAYQRPGFLDALGPPGVAPALSGISCDGLRMVVFFVRSEQLVGLESALGRDTARLSDRACLVIVLQS